MLQLLPLVNKRLSLRAFSLAIFINISLAALIYGLTIGSNKQLMKEPIKIDFRQFTDSTVDEQKEQPELEPIKKPQQEIAVLPEVLQPSFDTPSIDLTQSISLPAITLPNFEIAPQLVDTTNDIQPQTTLTEANIGIAKVRSRTNPEYPYKARRLHVEGYVLLHVLIDDTGRPQEIKVIEETPPGYFAAASRKAVRRWEFEKTPAGTTEWKKVKLGFELN
jgi:protein TonB